MGGWVAQGVLPAPSAILEHIYQQRWIYLPHIWGTAQAALLGFVIGNAVALGLAVLIVRWPLIESWTAGVNIAIFTVPPIALVPVLVIVLPAEVERVVLAALTVYYPSLVAAVLGLRAADPRSVDLVRAYGGGYWKEFWHVRFRNALPTLLAGLRIAAPNAVLGAILGEFGTGIRWGLGSFLLGSIGRGDPAQLWGIGLVATAMGGVAYAVAWLIGVLTTRGSIPVGLALGRVELSDANLLKKVLQLFIAVLLPFVCWWLLVKTSGLSSIIVKGPLEVFSQLTFAPGADAVRGTLQDALGQTLPPTLLGLFAGILFAFLLAVAGVLIPSLVRSFMPVALVTQTMPLVALIPLIVLLLGRGMATTLAITISVTFFPAFVTIAQGLAEVPSVAFDVVRGYGAGRLKQLFIVAIPASAPHVLAATRLAAPRALLGVMMAEWLATGEGLGNLLNQSRGMLDYGMIWNVALVSVLIASLFYISVAAVEAALLRFYGMR